VSRAERALWAAVFSRRDLDSFLLAPDTPSIAASGAQTP
jgi:hypothetical protein